MTTAPAPIPVTPTATLLWDDPSPGEPGWFLRYTAADGEQVLDEIITAVDVPDALDEARAFLSREGLLR